MSSDRVGGDRLLMQVGVRLEQAYRPLARNCSLFQGSSFRDTDGFVRLTLSKPPKYAMHS